MSTNWRATSCGYRTPHNLRNFLQTCRSAGTCRGCQVLPRLVGGDLAPEAGTTAELDALARRFIKAKKAAKDSVVRNVPRRGFRLRVAQGLFPTGAHGYRSGPSLAIRIAARSIDAMYPVRTGPRCPQAHRLGSP